MTARHSKPLRVLHKRAAPPQGIKSVPSSTHGCSAFAVGRAFLDGSCLHLDVFGPSLCRQQARHNRGTGAEMVQQPPPNASHFVMVRLEASKRNCSAVFIKNFNGFFMPSQLPPAGQGNPIPRVNTDKKPPPNVCTQPTEPVWGGGRTRFAQSCLLDTTPRTNS